MLRRHLTKYGAGDLFIKLSKTFPSSFLCLSKRTLKVDSSLLNIKTLIQTYTLSMPAPLNEGISINFTLILSTFAADTVTLVIDEDRKVWLR